jgi:hypothetical protein
MADKPKSKPKAKPAAKAKKAKPAEPAKKAAKPAKVAKSAAKATKKAAESAAPEAESYYVSFTLLPAGIHNAAPAGAEFIELPSFDEARERLVEHLIETIEALESRLHAVRRIGTFDDYRQLG